MDQYSVIIVGGGPGGCRAARRLAIAGKKVLLLEKEALGGTCLNRGCIPSKTLIHAVRQFAESASFQTKEVPFPWKKVLQEKNSLVGELRAGQEALLKRAGVEIVHAEAIFHSDRSIRIGERGVQADKIILATGSEPVKPDFPGAKQLQYSRDLLELEVLPKSAVIIGGGIIGVEAATILSYAGCSVTVLEKEPGILPGMDKRIGKVVQRGMKAVRWITGADVQAIEGHRVVYQRKGAEETAEGDFLLGALGRKPILDQAEKLGLETRNGRIIVNNTMETTTHGIFAIGDLSASKMLAHTAERMADCAVSAILGEFNPVQWDAIPRVVYSVPEAAEIGVNPEIAEARSIEMVQATVPLAGNGRYRIEDGSAGGFLRVFMEPRSRRFLGAQMAGGPASEIISIAGTAIAGKMTVSQMLQTVYPHPSIAESFREALEAVLDVRPVE